MGCIELWKSFKGRIRQTQEGSRSPPRGFEISKPSNFVKADDPFAYMADFPGKPASLMSEKFTASNVALSHHPPMPGRTSPASSDPGKRSISTATFRYDLDTAEVGNEVSSTTVLVAPGVSWTV